MPSDDRAAFTVAVDPGKTCGVAGVYHYNGARTSEIAHGQISFDDFGNYMWTLLQNLEDFHAPTFVVCERFTISAHTVRKAADAHWALEAIGVARWQAQRFGRSFKLQSISDAEHFAPDQRLRDVGWYVPGRPHANDAIRHLTLALAEDCGILPPWV
jgi:hypothetical protein